MTLKSNKSLSNEVDDTWRSKGHSHINDTKYTPELCHTCGGVGRIPFKVCNQSTGYFIQNDYECTRCGGTGEV